jgi:putative peptidoglycan lipid II flippase
MLPFFALAQYFGWANDEISIGIRAIRLIFILTGSGLAYLFVARALNVSEIAGLKGFATSILQRRRKN